MLETLLTILRFDLPSPEILLEEDGCLNLTWHVGGKWADLSIFPDGKVCWAIEEKGHGTKLDEFRKLIAEFCDAP